MNEFHLSRMLATRSGQLLLRTIGVAVLACVMTSCATPQPPLRTERRYATHTFSFDARRDSPDIDILDFHYGGNDHPSVRGCPRHPDQCKPPFYSTVAHAKMEVADQLYVKWRIRTSGEIYEDVVDLHGRLPNDITGQRIHFIVSEDRLHVYLIGANKVAPDPCPPMSRRAELSMSSNAYEKIFSQFCYLPITNLYPKRISDRAVKVMEGRS